MEKNDSAFLQEVVRWAPSATIGSFFLSADNWGLDFLKAAEIQSQQSAQVKYHYVVESELAEAEKSAYQGRFQSMLRRLRDLLLKFIVRLLKRFV